MKKTDLKLSIFGQALSEISAQMKITVREICSSSSISSMTYSKVWFGNEVSITHYLRIYRYLYREADDATRQKLTQALLQLWNE